MKLTHRLECIASIVRFATDVDVRQLAEEFLDAVPKNRVIVDDQDAAGRAGGDIAMRVRTSEEFGGHGRCGTEQFTEMPPAADVSKRREAEIALARSRMSLRPMAALVCKVSTFPSPSSSTLRVSTPLSSRRRTVTCEPLECRAALATASWAMRYRFNAVWLSRMVMEGGQSTSTLILAGVHPSRA